MENIFSYAKKYGNVSFQNKKFNEIDNLVFSLLSYLDFENTSINENNHTLQEIGNEYFKLHNYKEVSKIGVSQKSAFKLLKILIDKDRYKNIVLSDYMYKVNKNMQFSALTFNISKNLKYICFEGTDELLCGWKEDGKLACLFPVPSHVEAINYVNKHIKLLGPNVIIGGHSKGGNLALVAAMYLKKRKKIKLKAIYNNDGPGLRKKEFESREYKQIKNKYIHIVPEYSFFGVMLRNDKYKVIKVKQKNILCHYLTNWIVNDDSLIETNLSEKSLNLEKKIIRWIEKYSDESKTKMVDGIFKIFEDIEITVTKRLLKIKNIIKILKGIKNLDKEEKNLAIDLIKI